MNKKPAQSFDPVLLDLADAEDYAIVVNALDEWAGRMEHAAEEEDDRISYNQLPDSDSDAPRLRAEAERARAIRDDTERQLDANSAARRRVRNDEAENGEAHD
ncbi:hypothetical protein [Microbacterium lacticum]|uniref:hypothetical protein n=1 Tax=Microbacterium lacticum TaxID=33885 RepID=UPI001F5A638B|nr:hypothetical protein [Microbacterium lacticum]